jgi:hypothetical protein
MKDKKARKINGHKSHFLHTGLVTVSIGTIIPLFYTTKNKLIDENGNVVKKTKICKTGTYGQPTF